jgi:hypothetical protein
MERLTKKKWRFEIISLNSNGEWRTIDEFEAGQLSLYQEQVDLRVQHQGVGESRVTPNELPRYPSA